MSGAGLRKTCYLVSSDAEALKVAKSMGISSVRESADAGVNSAVRTAVRSLSSYDSFMVVPADLPALSSRDLKRAHALGRTVSVVISPSASFTGTNLLLFTRRRAPRLSYDRDSFWNHLASSASRGLSVGVYTGSGVTLDLDTQRDVKSLLASQPDSATARYLREAVGA